jgi:nicotinamidase-related amidase
VIVVDGKDVPTTLPELTDRRRTALVVVDVQNDFCSEGGTVHAAGGSLAGYATALPRMRLLIGAARGAGVPVIHVRMLSLPGGRTDTPGWLRIRIRAAGSYGGLGENGVWRYTEPGTWGADFVAGLGPVGDEAVVDKYRSSAFFGTNLDSLLRAAGVSNVVVIGCTTEGCIDSTVRDAGFRDYIAVVPEDAVASDAPQLHEAALTILRAYRADVVTTEEILKVWA